MTTGECCMGAHRAAVGALHRAEQLLLQAISLLVIQLLIRGAQRSQGLGQVVGRLAERVEKLLAGLHIGRDIRPRVVPRSAGSIGQS